MNSLCVCACHQNSLWLTYSCSEEFEILLRFLSRRASISYTYQQQLKCFISLRFYVLLQSVLTNSDAQTNFFSSLDKSFCDAEVVNSKIAWANVFKHYGSSFLQFASLLLHGVTCTAVWACIAPCAALFPSSSPQSINRFRTWALFLLPDLLRISLLGINYCSLVNSLPLC